MNIYTYRVEKDAERHPFLVKERKFDYGTACLSCPEDVVKLVNYVFRLSFVAEEYVCLLSLDSKGHLLGLFEVSHGTIDSSHCNPREIYLRAIVSGARSVIVVHNHPSGDVNPSDMDIVVCKRLFEVGNLMGIPMDDFIIIGDTYYSFREKNEMSFI